jgi:xanthosine utilization system XapX-like protein
VGAGADRYAHLFGLGIGAVVGLGVAWANLRAPRPSLQALLGAVALAAVTSCWALALRPH